jgi:hypothetical protein
VYIRQTWCGDNFFFKRIDPINDDKFNFYEVSGAAVEVGVQIVLVPVQLRYTHDRGYRCYKGSYRGGMVQCFRTFVAKILI